MKLNIDTPTPEMDEEQAAKLDRDNVAALRKTINKTGINNSVLFQTYTSFNVTGATFYTPVGLHGVVTSSGGFFDIEFKTSYRLPASGNLYARLMIDEKVQDLIYAGISNPQVIIWPLSLRFRGPLGEGRHKISVEVSLSSGTGQFSDSDTLTRLQATETLL